MLDELLGRAELKAQIADLKEKKHHLERQLAAEEERRTDAVRERQEAEREVNQLQDRIEGLEERVERLSESQTERDELSVRTTQDIRGARRKNILDRIRSVETGPEGALTAMVTETVPNEIRRLLDERSALVQRLAPCLVCIDDAGMIAVAIELTAPPTPFVEWGTTFRIEPQWVAPAEPVTVAVVRSDIFALGVYDGSTLTHVTDVTTDVMDAHSKGGFSQARFERRRDQQIEDHLEHAHEAIETHLTENSQIQTSEVVVLGEKTVLGAFSDLAGRRETVDATGEPKSALEDAVDEFWTIRVSTL
ncbi:Vms1/Ankzf1 family peptidyl-tRNA hydrolase [Haloquadratum walsbyi]|uniref:Vms1/Ankzf1 family peptidyl-tRNA hydrolase n=1 Tax=Haloquadratum walsbyi TaxID=293091 RepID=UPI0023F478D0|nr:Vms1/Ankzf1 family peptidyl-tRNA hydrolase [Haloquadratum walsbyi]